MENLRLLREQKRITQVRLAIEIGVSQETISAYESDKALPAASTLIKIADYLDTTTDYLLDRLDEHIPISRIKTNNLTDEETDLLFNFKNLTEENKTKVKGYIDALKNI